MTKPTNVYSGKAPTQRRKRPKVFNMTKPTNVYLGSGNVFADLRIPNPDQYLAKAELAAQILKIVRRLDV